MAKTKISEFSANPSNNTDIDGINIAEGCAPSGINNAIRELMSQLKDQQTGTSGDDFTVGNDLNVTGNLDVTGNTTLGGTFTSTGVITLGSDTVAATQSTSDNSTKVATTAFVQAIALNKLGDTASNGIVARTADNTTAARTITAGTGISMVDGDGVAGNPTITNTGVTSINSQTGTITLSSLTDFASSLTSPGYQKLPGGLIMQWGSYLTTSNSGSTAVTFPIAFTTSTFCALTSEERTDPSSGTAELMSQSRSVTTTGMTLEWARVSGSDTDRIRIYWLAIGI